MDGILVAVALYLIWRLAGAIDFRIRFWQLNGQFEEIKKEMQEYERAGHVLNWRAAARRLCSVHDEMRRLK